MSAQSTASRLLRVAAALFLSGTALWAHAAAPDAGTTAAQVNGTSISRAELDQLVATALATVAAGTNAPGLQLAAVDQLIAQQLFTQSALRAGLNTQAATRLQVARARRQVLGEAYLRRQLVNVAQPTAQQIDQFIAKNPKLFGERLTYHYTRATLDTPDDWSLERLQGELQIHKDLVSLQVFFQRNKLPLRTESLWLGSEQIAPDQLKTLEAMPNGQLKWLPVVDAGKSILLLRHQAYPDAKDPALMRGAIARGMWLEAVDTARREHLVQLRQRASVVITPAGQAGASVLAARVNADEISLAELSQAINPDAADAPLASISAPAVRQKVLDTLIDEALLAQQALALGLERQPAVAEQLKQVESSILINRFLALEMAKLPTPPLIQVNYVVGQQSELFAKRKVYRFSEFIINQAASERLAKAQQALTALADPKAIEGVLTQLGWSYGVNHLWRGPDQLNPQYRKELAGLAVGKSAVLAAPGGKALVVLYKSAEFPDPIGTDEAQAIARQLLVNANQAEATQALLTRLRSEARVALAPDLMAAQQQLMAPAFRLQALTTQQQQTWLLATLQVMALVLLPATLFWFYRTSRGRVEFAIWRDAPSRWLDRWNEASHAAPFFGALSLTAGALTLLLALPLGGLLKRQALPPDGLVIAGGVGVGLVSTVLVLFWLHSRQAQARAGDANRWLPLGAVLLLQALLTLVAIYAF